MFDIELYRGIVKGAKEKEEATGVISTIQMPHETTKLLLDEIEVLRNVQLKAEEFLIRPYSNNQGALRVAVSEAKQELARP